MKKEEKKRKIPKVVNHTNKSKYGTGTMNT